MALRTSLTRMDWDEYYTQSQSYCGLSYSRVRWKIMVQEFVVLRCYSCQTFQVHQIKKVLKWNCKVCGEKQSRKKVYGQGKAIDCRKHVQRLNMIRGHIEDNRRTVEEDGDIDDDVNSSVCSDGAGDEEDFIIGQRDLVNSDECFGSVKSKWSKFMTTTSSDQLEDNESVAFQVTTERVQFDKAACKRKRREGGATTKNPAKKTAGKAVKKHFLELQKQQECDPCTSTDPSKSLNMMERVCAPGRDKVNDEHSDRSQPTSSKLHRAGVNISSTSSTRGDSLFRQSKWLKFLSPSSDENAQPNSCGSIAPNSASSPECSHNFSASSHSLSGQTSDTYSCSNTKEMFSANSLMTSAKFNSVFRIDNDLEEEWLDY